MKGRSSPLVFSDLLIRVHQRPICFLGFLLVPPEPPHHPLPLHSRILKIHQQTNLLPRSLQVIETLRRMLSPQPIRALQPDRPPLWGPQRHHQLVLNDDVHKITPHIFALVSDLYRHLRLGSHSPQPQLLQQRPLINFLQKPRPQRISNLQNRPQSPSRSNRCSSNEECSVIQKISPYLNLILSYPRSSAFICG